VKLKFRNALSTSYAILEGMEISKKEMQDQGLWNEKTTLEDWSGYAGRNVKIFEQKDSNQPERLNPEDHIEDNLEMICE
jgi:hypothetical protein